MESKITKTKFAPAEKAPKEELKLQTQTVSQASLLVEVIDAMPEVVLIINRNRQVIFANRALTEILGVKTRESVYGQRPGDIWNCIHAVETEGGCGTTETCRTCGAVIAILSSQKGKPDIRECRIIKQSTFEALDLLIKTVPLKLNHTPFTIFSLRDISHEKRRRILERIFFHDVLNTAGGVFSLSEVLKDARPDEMDELIGMIHENSERLIEEIKAQRDLVLAENNELSVCPIAINTREFLEGIVLLFNKEEIAKEINLVLDPKVPKINFVSDLTLLSRVIENMVKNALEASGPGQKVTVGCEKDGERIQFWVHNQAFMPRKVQLQVFKRSFTTKGKGRGIGSYSMRLISERYLNGEVSFESSRQKGTKFVASYPLTLDIKKN